MSSHIDKLFINKLASRLEGFIWKSGSLANCRCFSCGDSSVKKNKKRMYFYPKDNMYVCYCHNCGYSANVSAVLKRLDYSLYKEYTIEALTERRGYTEVRKPTTAERLDYGDYYAKLGTLDLVQELPKDHQARIYLESRHLSHCLDSFRFASSFRVWTNYLIPGKFSPSPVDEPRIVIPFFSEDRKFFAYTARLIGEGNGPRYILIVLDHSLPLLFGVDKLDKRKKITAVEGPIDSTHLRNCIALAGSNISSLTSIRDYSKITVVFDNEPRHKETFSKIQSAIHQGYDVCIWPSWVEHKDINSMVCSGWKPEYIQEIIDSNTYGGMDAKIRLTQWSRR